MFSGSRYVRACLRGLVLASGKFENTICSKPLEGFHQIYSFGVIENKDEVIRF